MNVVVNMQHFNKAINVTVPRAASVSALREEVVKCEKLSCDELKFRHIRSDEIIPDNALLCDVGVQHETQLDLIFSPSKDSIAVRLMALLQKYYQNSDRSDSMSFLELAIGYSYDVGLTINQALELAGAPKFIPYIESRTEFQVDNRCVRMNHDGQCWDTRATKSHQRSHSHSTERFPLRHDKKGAVAVDTAAIAIGALTEALKEMFLNITKIRRIDSREKGTKIESDDGYGQILVFVMGVPSSGNKDWLSKLLVMLESIVKENIVAFQQEAGIERIERRTNHLRLSGARVTLDVYPSSILCYDDVIDAMAKVSVDQLPYYESSLLEHQMEFVMKFSKEAKEVIRVLKNWREQQKWTSPLQRPSDTLFEMIVAFVVDKQRNPDIVGIATSSIRQIFQDVAGIATSSIIKQAFYVLEHFSEFHLARRDYSLFAPEDVPDRFRDVRPLVLDAANPYGNLVDATTFDYTQMVSFAKQTLFGKPNSRKIK